MINPACPFAIPVPSPLRRPRLPAALAMMSLLFAAPAQAVLIHAFDATFTGDDPGGSFSFDLIPPPTQPLVVTFDGYVENLNFTVLGHTGVVFSLYWRDATGISYPGIEFPSSSFLDLPVADPILGPQRVPVRFSMPASSPASVTFTIDGQGPADNFHVVGSLTADPVPEPDGIALLGMGFAGIRLRRR